MFFSEIKVNYSNGEYPVRMYKDFHGLRLELEKIPMYLDSLLFQKGPFHKPIINILNQN